jgi:hypothetical protein
VRLARLVVSPSKLDLRELKLRVSPWLALFLGVSWILVVLVGKRGATSWRDVYPGICLVAAGLVLFGLLRYLDRPLDSELSDSEDRDESGQGRGF